MMLSEMGFDRLKGIGSERAIVQPTERAVVEKLFDMQAEIFGTIEPDRMRYEHCRIQSHIDERLADLEFSADDLRDYVLANANNELPVEKQQLLGSYTGALLSMLTYRARERKERFDFYIDGKGNQFDELFHGAHYVDVLVVDNFKGNNLCECIGSNFGDATVVVARNCEGQRVLGSAAHYHGRAHVVIASECRGEDILSHAASGEGAAGIVAVVGGEHPFMQMRNPGHRGSVHLGLCIADTIQACSVRFSEEKQFASGVQFPASTSSRYWEPEAHSTEWSTYHNWSNKRHEKTERADKEEAVRKYNQLRENGLDEIAGFFRRISEVRPDEVYGLVEQACRRLKTLRNYL